MNGLIDPEVYRDRYLKSEMGWAEIVSQIQNDAFNAGVKCGADKLMEILREKLEHGPIQISK